MSKAAAVLARADILQDRRREIIKMKKRYDLIDLDCANCAAKMEEAIKKIEGVEDATVSFMAQKLTIEAAEEDFDKIMKKVVKAIRKVEPDCEVVL